MVLFHHRATENTENMLLAAEEKLCGLCVSIVNIGWNIVGCKWRLAGLDWEKVGNKQGESRE